MLLVIVQLVSAEKTSIDTNITAIWSMGKWENKGKEGTYRFILYEFGHEHIRGELWIQWLEWKKDEDGIIIGNTLLSELPIKELNQLGYAIGPPKCLQGWTCKLFEVEAFSSFEGLGNKSFEVSPVAVGSYKINEKTKK